MPADASSNRRPDTIDCVSTDPGTLAGRYLRRFWQPIYHSADLVIAKPVPLRIMGEAFTLYRGESGQVHLVDARCPHRATQLSSGWVEGEGLRCFYHGWKFDGEGQCVEQPAEDSSYCDRIKLASHPVREYLGLVFAFLGEGAPPDLPLFPEFDAFGGVIEVDSYYRECNYFQNVENALDMSHVGFVHRDNMAAYNGIGRGAQLRSEESVWGIAYTFTRADGRERVQQFGMPNVFYMTALPTDAEVGWQESLFWWVPIDDLRHMQFSLHRIPVSGEAGTRVKARHQERRVKIDLPHQRICDQILRGRLSLRDVDKSRVDLVRLQDDIAQVGQGRIADRDRERPGRADTGVIAIRRLWQRELAALSSGGALKSWRRDATIAPRAWGLAGTLGATGTTDRVPQSKAVPDFTDIRPQVEIDIQLDALHGAPPLGAASRTV
ncbi:MAG TPA: aromatic ring-hydroxylating dioxygenase subunit alpha [Stellaceae bacterium]|nr:aromatic ring-hydroxylating dioxygenase subunit alpha [Stellaceae bacterium]